MKILYWAGHIGNKYGAYEKYILLLAKMCQSRGHQFIVLHEDVNTVSCYRNALSELEAEYVSIPHTLQNPNDGIRYAILSIQKLRPDIVHFNFTNPLIMPMAKLLGVPLTYRTCHNGISRISVRTRLSRMMNNGFVDRFFAVSNRVRNDEISAGVQQDKLFLNLLGLPIENYQAQTLTGIDERLPFGWNHPQITKIITIGRFFPEKGMSFVTRVAIETMRRFPDVVWWMVGGSGPEYEFCEDLVKQSRLQDRIVFLGQRNDVPALLKQSYIQVVGSLFEGLPLNVLESSLLGVPTIGPNIHGLDEAIENDQTGVLIPTRTVEDFVAAISHMLEDPQLRNRIGENAKRYVVENHNSCRWIEQLVNYYELDYSRK